MARSPRPTRDPTAARRSGATPTTRGRCRSAASRSTTTATSPASIGLALRRRGCCARRRAGSRSEALWLLGPARGRTAARDARRRHDAPLAGRSPTAASTSCAAAATTSSSTAAPSGSPAAAGHGHNDCLAFEAVLDGAPVLVDCGSYVYTASRAGGTTSGAPRRTTRRESTGRSRTGSVSASSGPCSTTLSRPSRCGSRDRSTTCSAHRMPVTGACRSPWF